MTIDFIPNTIPIPFEQEDPELGGLIAAMMQQVERLRAKYGFKRPRLETFWIDRWSAEAGLGRNDRCPCGSGNKFKRCCLGT